MSDPVRYPPAVDHAVEIVSAYIRNNPVSAADLPKLIADVHSAVKALHFPPAPVIEAVALKPAVAINKSVGADRIICLEDGKGFKSLKRHLRTTYNLSPDEYRKKWGLTPDYPMVAPGYSAVRSRLAKENGLGRKTAAVN